MRKRLMILLFVSLVVAVPACEYNQVVPTPPRLPSPTPLPTVEMVTLTLRNDSRETICVVYVSPTTSETLGDNLLGDEAAAPGDTRTFEVPVGILVLRAYDCDGNELITEEGVQLYRSAEWRLDDATIAGGLDLEETPGFGETDLGPGFAPDPHVVSLNAGGEVEVALLDLGVDCRGFASNAPDYRFTWWGEAVRLHVFFVADGGEHATLILFDPDERWLCNDGLDEGPDPMVEIGGALSGQYDIWVGSCASGESIAGTLYITAQDYDPRHLP